VPGAEGGGSGSPDVPLAVPERTHTRGAVLGVIPARLGSERLPRKPLHSLAGRPLIEWVWRRVSELGVVDDLVVATDSQEVAEVCHRFGARAVLTSPAHQSGTERVAEVAARSPFREAEVIVNIQGDEPFVTPTQLTGAVAMVREGWDLGTVAAPVGSLEAWHDPAVVKVTRDDAGGALYFSRSPIPHTRGRDPTAAELASPIFLRHIGIYAYTPPVLQRWVALPASTLEQLERLEQLRALAAGLTVGVALVDDAEGGVDTPEDAARAERRLRTHESPPVTRRTQTS
jgi:3-deoxy-manno-octulosonate cytidylyltransferase (CMP-KDO synthetase)